TEFFAGMIPPTITHQQKKIAIVCGKPRLYEPDALKAARAGLMAHLGRYAPETPYTGGVRLVVKWLFPATAKRLAGTYRITKPDTDNLQKMLKDVLTDLRFWTDDALVCSETAEKFWNDIPGIYIRISDIEER
ncbi:MAG: RusA family crossover junction endodeoxyribonuclease, partial [Clostridia bacterium]